MEDEVTGPLLADPLETLQRVLDREVQRADRRKLELAEIGNALHQLAQRSRQPADGEGGPVWEPVSADLAPTLIEHLIGTIDGPLRHCVVSLDFGPGLEQEIVDAATARLRAGREQRAIYPMSAYHQPDGRRWIDTWARAGEVQRICVDPPTDFAVFGERAVLAVSEWGVAESNYVLVRDPMLVGAFISLFERVFAQALPVPSDDGGDTDSELLRLLGAGLKDEAIARYLGCSLRTVRRRVSALMDRYAVDTRFQLGAAVGARGLVDLRRPPR
ncbi:MAG TPA: hypothetical protein VH915_08640 [Pedococcus sp.]|jgi:DNA-binding CsgD family transcriptional regulator